MSEVFSFRIAQAEFLRLFRHLKDAEDNLEPGLLPLLSRMENEVFRLFTIEEYEAFRETGCVPASDRDAEFHDHEGSS